MGTYSFILFIIIVQVWKAVGDKERDSPISCSVEESEAISTGLFSLVILKSQ